MIRLRGDFAKLAAMRRKLEKLTSPSSVRGLNAVAGAAALAEAQRGFREGRDPYGNRWPAVARNGKPLLDTGRLRNSLTMNPTARGFEIGTNVRYAATHQFGATIRPKRSPFLRYRIGRRWVTSKRSVIPARPFMPTGRMPPAWGEAMSAAGARFMSRIFRGR